jgi:hypothetical protein
MQVGVGASLEQEPEGIDMTFQGGKHHGSVSVSVACIGVSAGLE